MEMRYYRKILHISYKDHVTNEEVRANIQQAIGPHDFRLTIVKRCKLQWYGHVSRSSGRITDDIDGLTGEEEELANLVERLDKASVAYGMEISAEKTKLMKKQHQRHQQGDQSKRTET